MNKELEQIITENAARCARKIWNGQSFTLPMAHREIIEAIKASLVPIEREQEQEIRRWQDSIRDAILKECPGANIDGAGCDSGDPLDFTLSEIGQGINWWANKHFDLERERDKLREKVQKEHDWNTAIEQTVSTHQSRVTALESSAAKVRQDALREAINTLKRAGLISAEDLLETLITTPASNTTDGCEWSLSGNPGGGHDTSCGKHFPSFPFDADFCGGCGKTITQGAK